MRRPDRDTIVDICWPLTGTPTEDDLISAAIAVRQLVHYLNHAASPTALRDVATVHQVTTNMGAAVTRIGPVLDQLAKSVTRLARAGALTDDRANPTLTAGYVAGYATGQLTAARDTLGALYDHLAVAAGELSHLHATPMETPE